MANLQENNTSLSFSRESIGELQIKPLEFFLMSAKTSNSDFFSSCLKWTLRMVSVANTLMLAGYF